MLVREYPKYSIKASNCPLQKQQCGFTLVEIAIVIVIIGLVIGGVMVGRSLISTAEVRSQMKQIDNYKLAANAFKLKYGAYPGDLPPSSAASMGFFTFTGTNAGKKIIVSNTYYGFGDNSGDITRPEQYVFWQHLGQAAMIEGKFGGPNTNPLLDRLASTYTFFRSSSLSNIYNVHMNVNQIYYIDSKIDDGVPARGNVREWSTQFGNGDDPCIVQSAPYGYDFSPDTANDPSLGCEASFLW